jgi:hypothetical protein
VIIRRLPIRDRFDLGIDAAALLTQGELSLHSLADPKVRDLIDRLIALTDADPEADFDDLGNQFTVAFTALEHNLDGLYAITSRMSLADSSHREVRKLLAKSVHPDSAKIGPNIAKHFFLYRPVMADLCSYEAMFIDERFSFAEIHLMHELLDVKQFSEITSLTTEG